jgi:putative PIN family toxin of toxin-antitoxin system
MIRAVLDTNTLVSAIIQPKGKPGQIYRLAVVGYEFLSSEFILQELTDVLERGHIQKKYQGQVTQALRQQFLDNIRSLATIVDEHTKFEAVKKDKKDNRILAAGADGGADYLVTGDPHLLELDEFQGIKIVTPNEFLEILQVQA